MSVTAGGRVSMPVVVVTLVVVRVIQRLALAADVELGRTDAGARHALGPHRVRRNRQASQCRPHLLERHARIDQRAQDHVPRGTGEAVEVEDPHDLTILQSFTLQPRTPNLEPNMNTNPEARSWKCEPLYSPQSRLHLSGLDQRV